MDVIAPRVGITCKRHMKSAQTQKTLTDVGARLLMDCHAMGHKNYQTEIILILVGKCKLETRP